MANWNTTIADLTVELFASLLLSPFRVETGLKEDKNSAGYKPEKSPTSNPIKIIAAITMGWNKLWISKDLPDISLNIGRTNKIRINANIIESEVSTKVSPKNCETSCFLLLPSTLRTPISFARFQHRLFPLCCHLYI